MFRLLVAVVALVVSAVSQVFPVGERPYIFPSFTSNPPTGAPPVLTWVYYPGSTTGSPPNPPSLNASRTTWPVVVLLHGCCIGPNVGSGNQFSVIGPELAKLGYIAIVYDDDSNHVGAENTPGFIHGHQAMYERARYLGLNISTENAESSSFFGGKLQPGYAFLTYSMGGSVAVQILASPAYAQYYKCFSALAPYDYVPDPGSNPPTFHKWPFPGTQSFAPALACPVSFISGLSDPVSVPTSVLALYGALTGVQRAKWCMPVPGFTHATFVDKTGVPPGSWDNGVLKPVTTLLRVFQQGGPFSSQMRFLDARFNPETSATATATNAGTDLRETFAWLEADDAVTPVLRRCVVYCRDSGPTSVVSYDWGEILNWPNGAFTAGTNFIESIHLQNTSVVAPVVFPSGVFPTSRSAWVDVGDGYVTGYCQARILPYGWSLPLQVW